MNKQIIIACAILISGWVSFNSCNNSGASVKLQNPVVAQHPNNNGGKADSGGTLSAVKEKATDDLLAAYMAETAATLKYAECSKMAKREGYNQIALLFRAASAAEKVHANNHKAVLMDSGIKVFPLNPEFSVKTTGENLQDAIKGETYEADTMYPEFLKVANAAENQMAVVSLNYAFLTEKKHRILFENALAALGKNTEKSLPSAYYVCPTCGNTYDAAPPKRCGICITSSEKFLKIY